MFRAPGQCCLLPHRAIVWDVLGFCREAGLPGDDDLASAAAAGRRRRGKKGVVGTQRPVQMVRE
jgi:hypothetical protein